MEGRSTATSEMSGMSGWSNRAKSLSASSDGPERTAVPPSNVAVHPSGRCPMSIDATPAQTDHTSVPKRSMMAGPDIVVGPVRRDAGPSKPNAALWNGHAILSRPHCRLRKWHFRDAISGARAGACRLAGV